MATYCFAHKLVESDCSPCLEQVSAMLKGDPPYRNDITVLEAYSAYFPQADEWRP